MKVKFHPRDFVISNPFNVNELKLGISQVIDRIKGEMIVIFDSITGLLFYHSLHGVIRFIRGFTHKGGGETSFKYIHAC